MLSLMEHNAKAYYRFVEVGSKQHLVNDTGTGIPCAAITRQRSGW